MNYSRLLGYSVRSVLLCSLYVVTGKFGLAIKAINVFATLFWAPTGISLVGLVLLGYRFWPAILLGAFLTNYLTGASVFVSLGIGIGNTLEAFVGALTLRRLFKFQGSLERVRDVFVIVVTGFFVASPISAAMGTLSLFLGSRIEFSDIKNTALAWWVGDVLSAITVAPFLFIWADRSPLKQRVRFDRPIECGALLLCLFLTCEVIFGDQVFVEIPHSSLPYLIFPVLIWSALRFGQKGAVTTSLGVSIFSAWSTLNGSGPFGGYSVSESLILLQVFQGVVSTTILILGAAVCERRNATLQLSDANRRCEALVQDRTAELGQTIEELRRAEDNLKKAYSDLEARIEKRTFELRRVNQSLTESETRLTLACEFGKVGLWELDMVTGALICNRQDEIQLGYQANSHRTLAHFTERVHPEDRPRLAAIRKNAVESKSPFEIEYRIIFPDRAIRWFSTRARAEYDSAGRAIRMLGANIEVTERKHAELALKQSEAYKSAIFLSTNECIISIDHHGRIIDFNPAAERTFGYDRKDLVGKEMAEFIIPPRLRDAHRKGLARYLATGEGPILGKMIELPAMRSDGSEFPVEITLLALKTASTPIFTGFARDITQRKYEEKTRKFLEKVTVEASSSLEYGMTLQRIAQLMVPDLSDWCVIHIREEDKIWARAISHFDKGSEHLAKEALEHFPCFLSDTHGVGLVFRTGQSEIYPLVSSTDWIMKALGIDYPELYRVLGAISSICVPLKAHGVVFGAMSFVFSDSGRRYGRNDLQLADELGERASLAIDNARSYLAAKKAIFVRDEFMSIASHEMKTPLTPLRMQLGLLKRLLAQSDVGIGRHKTALLSVVENSDQQIDRLVRLIDDLLDVTRITAGRLKLNVEEVNLSELVQDVVNRYRSEIDKAKCNLDVEADFKVIGHWDRIRIEQVFINLLTNALKYGAGKPIQVKVQGDQDCAKISVRDYGIGIKKEDQMRIFERFERAVGMKNIAGLGLGLFITRQIVHAHGGNIYLESNPGFGSIFIVQVPFNVPIGNEECA